MGAKSSQDAFQIKMDQILESLEGVTALHNDITVYGKDNVNHDRKILTLMDTAKKTGLTFNSKKCSM